MGAPRAVDEPPGIAMFPGMIMPANGGGPPAVLGVAPTDLDIGKLDGPRLGGAIIAASGSLDAAAGDGVADAASTD